MVKLCFAFGVFRNLNLHGEDFSSQLFRNTKKLAFCFPSHPVSVEHLELSPFWGLTLHCVPLNRSKLFPHGVEKSRHCATTWNHYDYKNAGAIIHLHWLESQLHAESYPGHTCNFQRLAEWRCKVTTSPPVFSVQVNHRICENTNSVRGVSAFKPISTGLQVVLY